MYFTMYSFYLFFKWTETISQQNLHFLRTDVTKNSLPWVDSDNILIMEGGIDTAEVTIAVHIPSLDENYRPSAYTIRWKNADIFEIGFNSYVEPSKAVLGHRAQYDVALSCTNKIWLFNSSCFTQAVSLKETRSTILDHPFSTTDSYGNYDLL